VAERPVECRPRLILSDPEAIARAARLARRRPAADALRLASIASGELLRLLPGWYGDAGPLSLYYPSRRMLPAKTRVFVDFVVERFRSAGFARLWMAAGLVRPLGFSPAARGATRHRNYDHAFVAGASMSALQLEAVSKHYGAAKAVDRISFATPSGKLVVLLGPSGCGKSTTLRMVAGLDTPSEGRILIDGRDVTSLAPAERRISMVFQSYALFPHLSVRENILFGVKVRKEPAADHGKRLARVAELLGLGALLERKPSQLSGGQQQRVALGRAIIAETKVRLMDEPLSNLDAQLRQEMRREIRTRSSSSASPWSTSPTTRPRR
jgi:ABC-type nitrate/sulfonate/bicarbonate transport system ATPase subunit